MWLIAEPLAKRPDQTRFADTGLAGQQHHLPFTFLGSLPALEQQTDLMFAPDHGQLVSPPVHSREAAFGDTLAQDVVGPDGSTKPLSRAGPRLR